MLYSDALDVAERRREHYKEESLSPIFKTVHRLVETGEILDAVYRREGRAKRPESALVKLF